jgi:Tfp pilus assembly protein PilN
MIRINLLGIPRAKKVKRPTFNVSGGVNTTVIVLAMVAAALIGNYGYYAYLTRESQKLQTDLDAAKAENAKLAVVKTKYQEREKVFQLYDRRVKVIHQLQEAQSGPSDLLNTVAGTVNNTDAVWLSTMNDDGKNINLVGTAISANAVANLISNLNKTNYFKTIEMKETFQDEGVKDLQAFSFSLVCEKKTKS